MRGEWEGGGGGGGRWAGEGGRREGWSPFNLNNYRKQPARLLV